MGKVKTGIGLLNLKWHPISSDAYTTAVELGSTVKAYLSIETNDLTIYGDDVLEAEQNVFKRGTLTTETWLDDLEVETKVFGGTYTSSSSEAVDNVDDIAPTGGVSFIRKLLKQDKTGGTRSIVYRAVFLPHATAVKSSQKDEADTKGDSLEPKTHPIDFSVAAGEDGNWRYRSDFPTLSEAEAYITEKTSATT